MRCFLFLQLLLRLQIHGFSIAPIVGILLSEIALDGKASTLSTEAFRWDWFGYLPKSFVHQDNHIPASSTEIKRLTGFPAGFFLPVRDTVRKFYPYY